MMTIGQNYTIVSRRLSKNWPKIVLAFIILSIPTLASLLVTTVASVLVALKYSIDYTDLQSYVMYLNLGLANYLPSSIDMELLQEASSTVLPFMIITDVCSVASIFFVLPLASYFLGVVKQENPTVLGALKFCWKSVPLTILIGIKVFLWTLLFIIPGIIKAFAYSQSYFVKVDNPDMPSNECITRSCEVMNGIKGKYFGLILVTAILCALVAAIPSLIINAIGNYIAAVMPSDVSYTIITAIVGAVVDVVVTIGAGVFTSMVQAVFYEDAKRSYVDVVESRLRSVHEQGDGFFHSDPFASNVSHGDPFDKNQTHNNVTGRTESGANNDSQNKGNGQDPFDND